MFYKINVSDTCCTQQQGVIFVINEQKQTILEQIQHIYLN